MTYPQAIVAAAALIAAGVAFDTQIRPAAAQISLSRGFDGANAAAGDRLWWVEPGSNFNRVFMCTDQGSGPVCTHTDVEK